MARWTTPLWQLPRPPLPRDTNGLSATVAVVATTHSLVMQLAVHLDSDLRHPAVPPCSWGSDDGTSIPLSSPASSSQDFAYRWEILSVEVIEESRDASHEAKEMAMEAPSQVSAHGLCS